MKPMPTRNIQSEQTKSIFRKVKEITKDGKSAVIAGPTEMRSMVGEFRDRTESDVYYMAYGGKEEEKNAIEEWALLNFSDGEKYEIIYSVKSGENQIHKASNETPIWQKIVGWIALLIIGSALIYALTSSDRSACTVNPYYGDDGCYDQYQD